MPAKSMKSMTTKPKKPTEPVIDYIVVTQDGPTGEVTVFKVSLTKTKAIKEMKKIIDEDPTEFDDGTLWSSIECDYESMIVDSSVRLIPIDSLTPGKLSDIIF